MNEATVGWFQSDIVIKSAVEIALLELKKDPGLIEDCLAGLPQDMLTSGKYGNKTIEQCKRWFASTEIEVLLGIQFRYLEKPAMIAIELGEENENEVTLADKNYQPLEQHPRKPGIMRAVESLYADASYTLAVFAHGEPELMLFLYSLVAWQLLRRKEDLLDARGFVVSRYSAGTASFLDPNSQEKIYVRTIRLNGKIKHSWPKKEGGIITSAPVAIYPEPTTSPPPSPTPIAFTDPNFLEQDILGFGIK